MYARDRTAVAVVLLSLAGVLVVALLLALAARSGLSAQTAQGASSAGRLGAGNAGSAPLSVAWVGDMTLGAPYGAPADAGDSMFARVRRELRAPELTIGNLEGTLGVGGTPKCGFGVPNCYAFQAPPSAAGALHRAGFDAVNVANNHFDDYGAEGRAQTTEALSRAGVGATGTPGYVRVLRRAGRTVALVGFSSYAWSAPLGDLRAATALVRQAARRADIVVVVFHGGAEGSGQGHTPRGPEYYLGENRGDLRAFAHAVIDAGADLVLGSGPHVLRGLEQYHSRLVAYSLGNFAGAGNLGMGGPLSLSGILQVRLRPSGAFAGGRLVPLRLTGQGTPEPDPSGEAARVVGELSREDFGTGSVTVAPDGRLRP